MKYDLTPIYLRAMDKIECEVEVYSCTAISYYKDKDESFPTERRAVQLYAEIFSPDGECGGARDPFALAVNSGPDPKGHRLIMLAMAATCWRDFLLAGNGGKGE